MCGNSDDYSSFPCQNQEVSPKCLDLARVQRCSASSRRRRQASHELSVVRGPVGRHKSWQLRTSSVDIRVRDKLCLTVAAPPFSVPVFKPSLLHCLSYHGRCHSCAAAPDGAEQLGRVDQVPGCRRRICILFSELADLLQDPVCKGIWC